MNEETTQENKQITEKHDSIVNNHSNYINHMSPEDELKFFLKEYKNL